MTTEEHCDVLIVGGGVGGCAAALAAASAGRRVILTEETDWIGGQFTSQAVPPDEHRWIESHGCPRRYRQLRRTVREYYREHYPLSPEAKRNPHLSPGLGGVSRLCCEPRVALAALEAMLSPAATSGRLEIMREHAPVAAHVRGDEIVAVELLDRRTGARRTVSAPYVLDATELGDLLALAGAEHVTGAESQRETGEPHAAGEGQPANVQAFTWCIAVGYDERKSHVIDRPAQYERWRTYVPALRPPWPGPLLSWTYTHPISLKPIRASLFGGSEGERSLWRYRRLICRDLYPACAEIREATLVNWPQNDYLEGDLIGATPEDFSRYCEDAKELSRSLLYWMQTEAPRPDGGSGYPGLYPRPDITGAAEGLAKAPYVRESRRIRARFTVTECHVGQEARGSDKAARFRDSVGVGYYRIDLHPSTGGDNYIDIASLPFQIPLGALIPVRLRNLLPAAKNIGTTHISNGCYRLHPVEWNIGEVAGLLATYALDRREPPCRVYENAAELDAYQKLLLNEGVELEWPAGTLAPHQGHEAPSKRRD